MWAWPASRDVWWSRVRLAVSDFNVAHMVLIAVREADHPVQPYTYSEMGITNKRVSSRLGRLRTRKIAYENNSQWSYEYLRHAGVGP